MAIKATALITLTRVNDGKGIKSTSVTYQIWSNGTSTPTGTWSSTPPKTTADKPYLWTRTVITYSDNTQSTSYSVGSTPEGIQVGGRNLIDRSDNLKNWAWSSQRGDQYTIDYADDYATINVTTPGTGWQYTSYKLNTRAVLARLKPNTDYTLSFKCEGEINGCNVDIRDGDSSNVITKTAVIKVTNGIASAILHTYDSIKSSDQLIYISGLNKKGMFKLGRPKLELGNKATDWTPAPEDVDEAINTERTERQSAIETKANEITSKVSETYVSNLAFEHYQNTVSTQFTQTKKDFTWSINQSVTDAKNEMSGQIDSVNGRLDGLKQTTDNVNSYMSFDNDALTLGKSDSAFKTKITNQEWSIQKNGAKVTYINDQTMYITDGQFTQSLKVGAFGFVPRANGSLDFKKVG